MKKITAFVYKHRVLLQALALAGYGLLIAVLVIPRNYAADYVADVSRGANLAWSLDNVYAGRPVQNLTDGNNAYYIVAAHLGKLFGLTQPSQIIQMFQLGAGFVALAACPLLWGAATRRFPCGIVAPVLFYLLLSQFVYVEKSVLYWAGAWVVAVAAPLLLILYRREWDKKSWLLFFALCAALAFANLIRVHAALPVALCAALLFCLKVVRPAMAPRTSRTFWKRLLAALKQTWKACLGFLGGLVLSYVLFMSLLPAVYNGLSGAHSADISGQTWHTLYIGLGHEENPYGIEYKDQVAFNKAEELNPGVVTYSAEYGATLRGEWMRLLREDPLYMLGSYLRKLGTGIWLAVSCLFQYNYAVTYFWVLFSVALSLALYRKTAFRRYGFLFLCLGICAFAGLLECVVAVPLNVYMTGSIAAARLLIFCLALLSTQYLADAFNRRAAPVYKKLGLGVFLSKTGE